MKNLQKIELVTKLEHKFILDLARIIDKAPKVLCHMYLHLPNIMYNGNDIKFVDFDMQDFLLLFGNLEILLLNWN